MGVYKCPVCEGRGQVPAGFYHTYHSGTVVNTCPETCKSCSGKGVIFDTDCFYPHVSTPLPDDYTFGYGTLGTICGMNSCSNCGHNDGMVYTSYPVKYKCTLTNEWHEASYTCKDWCEQCLQLFNGTDVSKTLADCLKVTHLNADRLEDNTVESINQCNITGTTNSAD